MRRRQKPRSVYWQRCCRAYVWGSRRELWRWLKEGVLYATGRHPLIAYHREHPEVHDLGARAHVRIMLDCIVWLAKIDWDIIRRRYKNGCPYWTRPQDERDYAITLDQLDEGLARWMELTAAWDPMLNGTTDELLDVPEMDPNAPDLSAEERKAIIEKRGVILDRYRDDQSRMIAWRGLIMSFQSGIGYLRDGSETLDGPEVYLLAKRPYFEPQLAEVRRRREVQRAEGVISMERTRLWAKARDAAEGVDSAPTPS